MPTRNAKSVFVHAYTRFVRGVLQYVAAHYRSLPNCGSNM